MDLNDFLKPAESPQGAPKPSTFKTHVKLFDLTKPDDVIAYEGVVDDVFQGKAALRWEKHYDVPGQLLVSWADIIEPPQIEDHKTPETHINPATGEPYLTQPTWPRGLPDDYLPAGGVSTADLLGFLANQDHGRQSGGGA